MTLDYISLIPKCLAINVCEKGCLGTKLTLHRLCNWDWKDACDSMEQPTKIQCLSKKLRSYYSHVSPRVIMLMNLHIDEEYHDGYISYQLLLYAFEKFWVLIKINVNHVTDDCQLNKNKYFLFPS